MKVRTYIGYCCREAKTLTELMTILYEKIKPDSFKKQEDSGIGR